MGKIPLKDAASLLLPVVALLGSALSAKGMTLLYEAPERDLALRSEIVVGLGSGESGTGCRSWPKGAANLVVEIWSEDEGEEPISLRIFGGKGKNEKLPGVQTPYGSGIEELPPNGSMLWAIDAKRLKKGLDVNAMSNIALKVESGKPCCFGVSRVFTLAKGEDAPKVEKPVPRHPRDAAEHAADFAVFKEECARGDFVIGWATSMENVRPRGGFKWRKADKVGVRLARGEYESVQILVAPASHDLKSVRVAVEMCAGFAATNVAASVVGYSETIHPPPYVVRQPKGGKMKRPPCGWYPDPILDFQKSCDISGNDVQSFWIRVKCPRDQKAGVYEGALVVSAAGEGSVRIPFSVRVNDFEVGRVSPLPLAISAAPGDRKNPDSWRNDWKKHPDEFCDFFADYFITPDQLYCNGQHEPHWDMLKRLKDQGRLNMFNLRYMWYMGLGETGEAAFREKILPVLKVRYEKAKKLGIEKHAYFYGFDELGAKTFTNCYLTVEQLHREFPDVPVMTTARDPLFGAKGSQLPNIDMHCPATCFWNPAQAKRARRDGRKVWWYFCNNPASPYANMTLEGPPCEIRSLMGAQTQKFKPDGFLYYATTHWYAKEPIKEGPFTKWEPRSYGAYHGDGQWTCCGGPDNMPLPTIRLENFRDGVEDLWYVKLLEKKLHEVESGKLIIKSVGSADAKRSHALWMQRARKLLSVPDDVVKSLGEFSTDPDIIYRWRNEMAELIECAK